MKTTIILSLLISYFIFNGSFVAAERMFFSNDTCYMTTGVVKDISRNTLEIEDEFTHEMIRVVYLDDLTQIHKGERVRVTYCYPGKIVKRLIKMTVLKYEDKDKNLGYILKNAPD